MRERAPAADLDGAAILNLVFRTAGTIFPVIQRTVTEQAVDLICSCMARIVFAVSVLEEPVRIIHLAPSSEGCQKNRPLVSAFCDN